MSNACSSHGGGTNHSTKQSSKPVQHQSTAKGADDTPCVKCTIKECYQHGVIQTHHRHKKGKSGYARRQGEKNKSNRPSSTKTKFVVCHDLNCKKPSHYHTESYFLKLAEEVRRDPNSFWLESTEPDAPEIDVLEEDFFEDLCGGEDVNEVDDEPAILLESNSPSSEEKPQGVGSGNATAQFDYEGYKSVHVVDVDNYDWSSLPAEASHASQEDDSESGADESKHVEAASVHEEIDDSDQGVTSEEEPVKEFFSWEAPEATTEEKEAQEGAEDLEENHDEDTAEEATPEATHIEDVTENLEGSSEDTAEEITPEVSGEPVQEAVGIDWLHTEKRMIFFSGDEVTEGKWRRIMLKIAEFCPLLKTEVEHIVNNPGVYEDRESITMSNSRRPRWRPIWSSLRPRKAKTRTTSTLACVHNLTEEVDIFVWMYRELVTTESMARREVLDLNGRLKESLIKAATNVAVASEHFKDWMMQPRVFTDTLIYYVNQRHHLAIKRFPVGGDDCRSVFRNKGEPVLSQGLERVSRVPSKDDP